MWARESTIRPGADGAALSEVPHVGLYKAGRVKWARPGMSWAFDVTEKDEADGMPNSVYFGSAREPRKWGRDIDVARWEAEDKAAYDASQKDAIVRRLAREGGLPGLTEPLRQIYKRLNFSQRSEFIVMVLDSIRSG